MHFLPEADEASVFVVGTVLYRNLGSFLALQRWGAPGRWGGQCRAGGVGRTPATGCEGGGQGAWRSVDDGLWRVAAGTGALGGTWGGARRSLGWEGSPDTCASGSCRNTTVLNSKVISVTVKPPPRSLRTPLEIEFAHMYNVSAVHVHTLMPAETRVHEFCPTPQPLSLWGLLTTALTFESCFYPWITGGETGSERCGDLPGVTQQVRCRNPICA